MPTLENEVVQRCIGIKLVGLFIDINVFFVVICLYNRWVCPKNSDFLF